MDAVKTYRYLRIAMIGMVVLLGAAILHEWWATGGRCFQTSISSYYYTPAKSAMVAALATIGVCLVVVKGNTEWEDTLLNLGGAVAPVIAFVPTPFAGACRSVPLQVTDTPANVANNVFALLVLGAGGLVVTVVVALRSRRTGQPLRASDLVGMAVAFALWVVVVVSFVWARSPFLEHAHYTAATVLFLCMIAVVIINAWSVGRHRARGAAPRLSDYLNAYAAVAVLMAGSVLLLLGCWFMGWQHAVNSEIALAERVGQPPVAQVGARGDTVDRRGSCRSSAFERYLTRHCEIVLTHRGHRGHRSPSSSVPLHVSPEQAAFVEAMLPVLSPPRGRQQDQPEDAGAAPDDSLKACLSAELDVIEAVERAKAALDAHALTALARMRATTEALVAEQPEPWRTTVPMSADELVALEVTTATGLSQREVHRRLTLATGPAARCGRLRDLVASGATSLYCACEVLEECATLSDEDLDRVLDAVFAPTRDGAGLTQTLFRSRLRRAILTVDAERAAAKARARSRIGAFARLDDDGTGTLTIINDAGKIAAAMDRADAAARAARAMGDPRTLEQLRADFLTDAVCYGWPTTAPCPGPDCAALRDSGSGTSGGGDGAQPGVDGRLGGGPHSGVEDRPAADRPNGADGLNADRSNGADRSSGADRPDADRSGAFGGRAPTGGGSSCCTCGGSGQIGTGFDRIGRQPAASVRVIVPFTTLFSFDNAPCELPGYGWIDAAQARALASVPDSTWQALLADLDTGEALRMSRKGYRPSQQMIEHVRAVDHTCRGPGCQVPADRCDLDHDIPYPIGPTDITNFTSKHRQHHRVRTARFWKAARGEHDEIIWETAAGRRYVTYPNDWLESTRPPAPRGDSSIDYDPEPFTRPIGPEPDPNQPAPDPGPPPF